MKLTFRFLLLYLFVALAVLSCKEYVVDDDRETVAELMLFDEDNTLLSQGLMQGLDEELDSFLKDLLAE